MKVTFKADKYSADSLILGLAKSGIPVYSTQEQGKMVRPGNIYITAEFPDEEETLELYADCGESPTIIKTVKQHG